MRSAQFNCRAQNRGCVVVVRLNFKRPLGNFPKRLNVGRTTGRTSGFDLGATKVGTVKPNFEENFKTPTKHFEAFLNTSKTW